MANPNVTRGADTATPEKAEPSSNLRDLQIAIADIDSMSQSAFSEIVSIARLALHALERPETYLYGMDAIAAALSAICGKAQEGELYINAMAGDVGCNYVDVNWPPKNGRHEVCYVDLVECE